MKVYNWKTLLVTVFVGGGLLVCSFVTVLRGNVMYSLWVVICLHLVISGLRASLTQEGYQRDRDQGALYKRVTRRLFGRLAPIMPFTPVILFVLFCSTWILRPPGWLYLVMMLGVIAYAVWLSWYIQRAVNRERAEEERLAFLNESDKE